MADDPPRKRAKTEKTGFDLSGPPLSWTATLNNGLAMPVVGFGTYKLKEGEAGGAIKEAVAFGYGLLDTAHVYCGGKMEAIVAKATRPGVFVTTKQWRGFHGYAETTKCLAQSLSRLKVAKVDLLLMHWPGPGYSAMGRSKERIAKEGIECYFKRGHEDIAAVRLETWRAMEDAYLAGKCGAIGVSNFSASHLRKLLDWKDLRVKPAVNQIELHPYLRQRDVVALCEEESILVQAYGSLGGQDSAAKHWAELDRPPLLEHPAVLAAAETRGKPPAAVLLRWAVQKGYAVIPKSRDKKRIRENADLAFALDDGEMAALDALDLGGMKGRLCWRKDELRDLDFA